MRADYWPNEELLDAELSREIVTSKYRATIYEVHTVRKYNLEIRSGRVA